MGARYGSEFAVAAVVFCLALSRPAQACAPAWSREAPPVQIASEEALVVWDAARHLEHFVRTATFEGGPTTFGFLVPVPTLPELAEADEQIFERIEQFWEGERPIEVRYRFEGLTSFMARSKTASAPAPEGVTLLSTARVAGMDAVVLEADSAKALGEWLAAREFVFRPELVSYIEPYVREHFKIVAFKYARDASAPRVGARAVRLSFSTERPFFPYREPRDATRLVPALFRLHVLSSTSMSGFLGEARTAWSAAIRYSGPFGAEPPPFARIGTPWITLFEESVQTRPAAGDLFFEPTSTPRPVAASPRVVERAWGIPIELVVVVVMLGVTVALILRGRASPGPR